MALDVDFTAPEFRDDPYPTYHRLRCEWPVARMQAGMRLTFMLSRHADVLSVLRHPTVSVDRPGQPRPVEGEPPPDLHPLARAVRALSRVMLFRDPPDHTHLRGLVNKAFTPRVVERLRPRIQALVDDLLAAPLRDGGMDLIRDLAAPLPVFVIGELLGVPKEDYGPLKTWSDDLAIMLDGTVALQHVGRALPSAIAFVEYLRKLVAARRASPQDDLVSGLIAAQEQNEALTEDEIIGTSLILLGAGHETTTNLIGNGLLALARHPAERARLAASPALMPSAVEELLRFDSPVQATSRMLREEMVIEGQSIAAGEEAVLLLGAANRDPAAFPEPDRLDVARRDNRHLAFGFGIHFCPGAGLARLEGELAVGTLLRHAPRFELTTDKLVRRPGMLFRGLESLPVRFG
jgi:hypothetical protein